MAHANGLQHRVGAAEDDGDGAVVGPEQALAIAGRELQLDRRRPAHALASGFELVGLRLDLGKLALDLGRVGVGAAEPSERDEGGIEAAVAGQPTRALGRKQEQQDLHVSGDRARANGP